MSKEIKINPELNKNEKYAELIQQILNLVQGEKNIIANMSNISAALKENFNWLWVGFYLVDKATNELVLGPFQGPVACTRIAYGKGVCGTSWKEKKSLLVPDVHKFPGHIACSSLSVSEIVIPVLNSKNEVIAILDIDSQHFNTLDETDVKNLETFAEIVANMFEG
ncbi:MAG: GAF domain-containing protein [Saprospiraceae bacterium]